MCRWPHCQQLVPAVSSVLGFYPEVSNTINEKYFNIKFEKSEGIDIVGDKKKDSCDDKHMAIEKIALVQYNHHLLTLVLRNLSTTKTFLLMFSHSAPIISILIQLP